MFFYFCNLLNPLAITIISAQNFLNLKNPLPGLVYIMLAISISGLVMSIVSNLFLAPWKQVLRLYFQLDSIVPVLVSTIISFYSMVNLMPSYSWDRYVSLITYPAWLFYFTGNLRVMLVYVKWKRWEVILYKVAVIVCGLVSFYIGFEFMRGKYKITGGYVVALEKKLKELVLLMVFANVDFFFELFKKLSEFDQTGALKFEYLLEDKHLK